MILLSIFISILYMFRASMCQSSGENCCIYATLLFVNLYGWRLVCWLVPTSRPDATHTEWQIPVSHRYSDFSWWWAHCCPKHVEKRNKYTKQNCAPSWIYLQDSLWLCTQSSIIKIQLHNTRVMKTNLMHYLSSVYFVTQPLHVSGISVYFIYTTTGTCCAEKRVV